MVHQLGRTKLENLAPPERIFFGRTGLSFGRKKLLAPPKKCPKNTYEEKALVGAFSVIVQPVVEPMDRFAALVTCNHLDQEQVGVPVEDAVVSVEGEPLGDGVLLREDPHRDHPPHPAQPVHCNSQDR